MNDLEGVLLKEGRKKAWKKRLLRVSPTQRVLSYAKEGKQKPKGTIDLSAMIGVQASEEQMTVEKTQYFIFEILLKEDTLRFGAADRLQLSYWIEGLRAILRALGAVVRRTPAEIMAAAGSDILPPFFPGEQLITFIPTVTLYFDSGNTLSVNCFLTNFKIHLMEPTANIADPESVNAPDSHGLRVTKHSVPITTCMRMEKYDEKEFYCIEITCYDLRKIRLGFSNKDLRNQLLYWANLFSPQKNDETFSFEYLKACDPACKPPAGHSYLTTGYVRYNPRAEFERLGIPNANWRISDINEKHELIPTYPSVLAIPASITDAAFKKICPLRTRKRGPVLCYHHPNGGAMLRSSQPKRGVTGANSRDETYLDCLAGLGTYVGKKKKKNRLFVYDARSLAAAQANRAIGGGFEDYKQTKTIFCDIENIHVVRDSWKAMMKLCANSDDTLWHTKLSETSWLIHNYRIINSAEKIAARILEGQVVLVHCSDGWDRTAQLTSIVSLLLDPYYRTIDGFELLIEKEWLSFGHQYEMRLGIMDGIGKESSEMSPIFLQFLECVWNLTQLFPTAFEFNEDFLVQIFDHCYSGCFGTFLCNSENTRLQLGIPSQTTSLWFYLDASRSFYVNPCFNPNKKKVFNFHFEMRSMSIWRELWYRHDEQESCSMYLSRIENMLIAANLAKIKAQREGAPEPKMLLTQSSRSALVLKPSLTTGGATPPQPQALLRDSGSGSSQQKKPQPVVPQKNFLATNSRLRTTAEETKRKTTDSDFGTSNNLKTSSPRSSTASAVVDPAAELKRTASADATVPPPRPTRGPTTVLPPGRS